MTKTNVHLFVQADKRKSTIILAAHHHETPHTERFHRLVRQNTCPPLSSHTLATAQQPPQANVTQAIGKEYRQRTGPIAPRKKVPYPCTILLFQTYIYCFHLPLHGNRHFLPSLGQHFTPHQQGTLRFRFFFRGPLHQWQTQANNQSPKHQFTVETEQSGTSAQAFAECVKDTQANAAFRQIDKPRSHHRLTLFRVLALSELSVVSTHPTLSCLPR